MTTVSIGIPAYNEEKNIGMALGRIATSKVSSIVIHEIIVVSLGSTDNTNRMVSEHSVSNPVIRLESRVEREGQAAALDLFIKKSSSDILAVLDADAFVERDSLERLLAPLLKDPRIGGTTGRKVPLEPNAIVRSLWEVHHQLNLIAPKMCGSIMAFRNVIEGIPRECINTDAYIQGCLEREGLRVAYVPDAVAETIEPHRLANYIRQRKRVYLGHLVLRDQFRIEAPTVGLKVSLQAPVNVVRKQPTSGVAVSGCVFVEMIARTLAFMEFKVRKTRPYIWDKVREQ